MKKVALVTVIALALLALVVGSFVFAARHGWPTPSEATLRARYTLPASRFMTIEGQSIHYVDEGKGVPVVLVHGSFSSLRMWDGWARSLKSGYRVIRFDRPPMGLSGADSQGRYGAAREAELIALVTARLSVRRFFLVATSSGGESAVAYAAAHPDQIAGVIFANIAAGPIAFHPPNYPWSLRLALAVDPYLGGWHMRAFWKAILTTAYADPAKVTPGLVREWTDLNNRAQFYPRQPRPAGYVSFAHTPADLASIHAPALVLWSDRDIEVPLAVDGRNTLRLLASTDKHLTVIPNCGHMMPLECGPASVAAARVFLDRVSQSLPAKDKNGPAPSRLVELLTPQSGSFR